MIRYSLGDSAPCNGLSQSTISASLSESSWCITVVAPGTNGSILLPVAVAALVLGLDVPDVAATSIESSSFVALASSFERFMAGESPRMADSMPLLAAGMVMPPGCVCCKREKNISKAFLWSDYGM